MTPEPVHAIAVDFPAPELAPLIDELDEARERAGIPDGPVHVRIGIKNGDREWFAKNAQRSHRLRRATPDETETYGERCEVVIRQVSPGSRFRLSIRAGRADRPVSRFLADRSPAWVDHFLAALFDALANGVEFVRLDDIAQAVNARIARSATHAQ